MNWQYLRDEQRAIERQRDTDSWPHCEACDQPAIHEPLQLDPETDCFLCAKCRNICPQCGAEQPSCECGLTPRKEPAKVIEFPSKRPAADGWNPPEAA